MVKSSNRGAKSKASARPTGTRHAAKKATRRKSSAKGGQTASKNSKAAAPKLKAKAKAKTKPTSSRISAKAAPARPAKTTKTKVKTKTSLQKSTATLKESATVKSKPMAPSAPLASPGTRQGAPVVPKGGVPTSTTAALKAARPVQPEPPKPPLKPPLKPKPKKSPFDKRQLEVIRRLLEEMSAELQKELEEIEEAAFNLSQSEMSGEVSYDEDYADSGSFTFEREKDLSIANNVQDLLDKIKRSTEKIDEGTYGICEVCGNPIEPARLKALPHALLCVRDKALEERR